MVTINGSTKKGVPWEISCESTDEKPVVINGRGEKVPTNSIAFELDIGAFEYFDGEQWQDVGGAQ